MEESNKKNKQKKRSEISGESSSNSEKKVRQEGESMQHDGIDEELDCEDLYEDEVFISS